MDLFRAQNEANELLAEALAPFGASGWVRVAPVGAWNVGGERLVSLPDGSIVRISHDERGAPFVLAADGAEDYNLLVSLTDEKRVAACAAAKADESADLLGVGIDLASPEDFAGERGERFNHLIFSTGEQRLAPTLADDAALGFAFVFSAKEAAFKACAAPLRRWYDKHDEELAFDVTEFELATPYDVRGTLRHAHANRAMAVMGIRTCVVRREICGFACTIAVANKVKRDLAPFDLAK